MQNWVDGKRRREKQQQQNKNKKQSETIPSKNRKKAQMCVVHFQGLVGGLNKQNLKYGIRS